MELYERALTFNPQHAEALYRLAEACGAEGQLHRALFLLEMCVHFCPTSADAFNALGLLHKVCVPTGILPTVSDEMAGLTDGIHPATEYLPLVLLEACSHLSVSDNVRVVVEKLDSLRVRHPSRRIGKTHLVSCNFSY